MRISEYSVRNINEDQKNKIIAVLAIVGVSFALVGLFIIGQVHIAFAGFLVLIISILFILSPVSGILALLVGSATTGFFDRIAIYLTGNPAPVDYLRFGLEVLIILFGFRLLITRPTNRNRIASTVDKFVWLYLIFSTIYTFNLIFVGPKITVWGWRWVCLPIIMYFLGRRLGNSPGFIKSFFRMTILLLLMLSAYAIYQAAVGLPFFEKVWFNQLPIPERAASIIEGSLFIAGKPRLPSMTTGHVSFTLLAGYLFILVLLIPRNYLTRFYRFSQFAALILVSIYLYLTLERSAIAMILIGVVSIFFLSFRRRLGRIAWVVILIVSLLGIVTMSLIDISNIPWTRETIALRRIAELANPLQATTVIGRATSIWPVALERLIANPLGYGLGTFHTTRQNQALGYDFFIPPHNMYLQILLEIGIIGLIIFFGFIFSYVRLLIKALVEGRERKLVIASFAGLAAILAVGMVNYPLEPPLAFFFWMFTGATTSYFSVRNTHQTREVPG